MPLRHPGRLEPRRRKRLRSRRVRNALRRPNAVRQSHAGVPVSAVHPSPAPCLPPHTAPSSGGSAWGCIEPPLCAPPGATMVPQAPGTTAGPQRPRGRPWGAGGARAAAWSRPPSARPHRSGKGLPRPCRCGGRPAAGGREGYGAPPHAAACPCRHRHRRFLAGHGRGAAHTGGRRRWSWGAAGPRQPPLLRLHPALTGPRPPVPAGLPLPLWAPQGPSPWQRLRPRRPRRWRRPRCHGDPGGSGRRARRKYRGRKRKRRPCPSGPWRRGGSRSSGSSMADAASQVLLGSGLTVLSQPLMYVKVLVQVRGGATGTGGTRRRCWYRGVSVPGTGRASPRRWVTSRCRPRWAGTSSAARSTSCRDSSPTVSERPREPRARCRGRSPGGRGGPGAA